MKKKDECFETSSGLKKIGVAPRYSGVMSVSKTSDHVQVIYEKKKAYGIGWIDRGLYHKEAIPYNGNENSC